MVESPVAEYDGQRRPDASMSLLNHLMTNTLDEDYAAVAAHNGGAPRRVGKATYVGVIAATLAFGLLLAVAAVQTDRSRPAAAEERAQLVERIQEQSDTVDGLRDDVSTLSAEVGTLETDVNAAGQRLQQLEQDVSRLGVAAGAEAVEGPGVQITVDDAEPPAGHEGQVLDTDLQSLVNGLWVAGAEAISINGQRITTRSSIRSANQAITLNFRSLRRPYVVNAIGNPDTLAARLLETPAGEEWLGLKNNFGVRFDTVTRESLTVPERTPGRLWYSTNAPEVPE
jgi:uncharacterized protein YlxW (UPF0749 family)